MRVALPWVMLSLFAATPALAQLSSQLVVSGLSSPVAVVQDPTQPNVQFIVEQAGRIRVVRNGQLLAPDFIDLTPLVLSGGERGLLGLAFAPDYATSRRFFVNYTRRPDGHTVISRYRRSATDPVRADAATRFDLRWPGGNAFIAQPFANHNGGDLQFGSDGYLYVPLGDGGGGDDPDHRAQDPTELLGKILRIDVDVLEADFEGYDVPADNPFVGQGGVHPEIWAFGLRNPFRFTVDAIARGGSGALVIGDVGQNAWEEIDYEPFGAGGRNYGWRNREGAHSNVTTRPPAFTPLIDPIAEYSHAVGNVITGGVVYRGTALGVGFFGRYFFADFGARRLWSLGLVPDGTGQARAGNLIEHTSTLGAATIGNVSAFGIGANCEVFFLNWSGGQLRRFVNAGGGPAPGCPTSPDPFLSAGGGVFVSGQWVTRDNPAAAGAGLGGAAAGNSGGCPTAQPVSTWVCVGGNWVPPDHPLATGASGGGGTGGTTGGSGGTGTNGCTSAQPASDWVCVSGSWVPPGHPLAGSAGGSTGGSTGGTGGTGGGGTSVPTGCLSTRPASDWVCVSGGWVPPGHPLASGGSGTGGSDAGSGGGTGTSGTCSSTRPASDWVCVSGNWVPPGHPLAGG